MKTYIVKCPNCDSKLQVTNEQLNDFVQCKYCRNEIFLDDEIKKIEISKKVNYNKTYTNTARVEEVQSRERIKAKELEIMNKATKAFIIIVIAVLLFVFSGAVIYGIMQIPSENEIKMTSSASNYKGENYEVVIAELEAAGFTNFETVEIDDVIIGLLTKEGEVEKISINGNSKFSEGTKFDKDSTVVVTYHVKKK